MNCPSVIKHGWEIAKTEVCWENRGKKSRNEGFSSAMARFVADLHIQELSMLGTDDSQCSNDKPLHGVDGGLGCST